MVDTGKPQVAGTPEIVLRCAECGGLKPVGGTRFVHEDLPKDPLCEDCFALALRFGGEEEQRRLSPIGPASDVDEDGTLWVRRTCPRCGGAGQVGGFRGDCFRCWGYRWTYVCPANVQRVMRWSATFQANRIPRSQI